MSEHDDDLESTVHEGALSEADTYSQTEEEADDEDDEDENEKPNPDDEPASARTPKSGFV